MKANRLYTAALAAGLALFAAAQAGAQVQQPRKELPAAAPVDVTVPSAGLRLDFREIDRNGDSSISVEEWNAFVASLQSRVAQRSDSSGAATGGSTSPKQPAPKR